MWWPRAGLTLLLLGLALGLSGCGYQFPARTGADLPGGVDRLYLEQVRDTSGEAGLRGRLRAQFTEEMERRTGAKWVDQEQSQGLVFLDVEEYQSSTSLEDAAERTIKSEVRIRISARIQDRQSGEQLWDSGSVTGRESFTGQGGEALAEREALKQAVENLVQRLGQKF
ncbi:MAG: LPS assembly lipoprotein LptE [Desulfohalobiaceae bacterium]